jgi:hypothetical protein
MPDLPIRAIEVAATTETPIAIGAITAYSGTVNPLTREPRLYVLTHDEGREASSCNRTSLEVDLGEIVRTTKLRPLSSSSWLDEEPRGWGRAPATGDGNDLTLAEVVGNQDTRLRCGEAVIPVRELTSNAAGEANAPRFKVLPPPSRRITFRILSGGGRQVPARVHFRTPEGRYLPPVGHRAEVNGAWFQDYGADLILGDTQYAYIPGEFQILLPRGVDVFLEVTKGFEYRPVRKVLEVDSLADQVDVHLDRLIDMPSLGWVSADTHVHFLGPTTARLEASAEGVNVVNILAAQWAELYTNVGDFTGVASAESDEQTLIWVGTENRQHFLGHVSLLGAQGSLPIAPLSTGGPLESPIGDGVESSLTEWALACKRRGGIAVAPHFPYPHGEVIASIVLGAIEGVELRDWWAGSMNTFAIHEWYRLLQCGWRVPAVGGTDKMSAAMPLGGVRTYSYLGAGRELSMTSWIESIRRGSTFTSSGPLLLLNVEGQLPGAEMRLPPGGGNVTVSATARCASQLDVLEIVVGGDVVASTRDEEGSGLLQIEFSVHVTDSTWIAARCISEHKAWHFWPIHFGAHTSPVYISCAGKRPWSPAASSYLVSTLQGCEDWLRNLATRSHSRSIDDVARYLLEAIRVLQTRPL